MKITASDIMSVEQMVALIKKRKDAATIFKNAMDDLREAGHELPPELEEHR